MDIFDVIDTKSFYKIVEEIDSFKYNYSNLSPKEKAQLTHIANYAISRSRIDVVRYLQRRNITYTNMHYLHIYEESKYIHRPIKLKWLFDDNVWYNPKDLESYIYVKDYKFASLLIDMGCKVTREHLSLCIENEVIDLIIKILNMHKDIFDEDVTHIIFHKNIKINKIYDAIICGDENEVIRRLDNGEKITQKDVFLLDHSSLCYLIPLVYTKYISNYELSN